MDMLELVREARSCRRFEQSKPLSKDDALWLVDCARLSPCGRNAQVLRYTVASTPEGCAAVFPHTRWAGALKDWNGPEEGERPTLFIGILTPKDAGKIVHMDTGVAAMTMQLAAASRGWGCCMHASFDPVKVGQAMHMPDDMAMPLLLAFGVAKEVRRIAPMPADGSFNYWRDAAQVHYVPKRTREEVIVSMI